MKYLLLLLTVSFLCAGACILSEAKTVLQEMEGIMLLAISAVLLSGACIVNAVQGTGFLPKRWARGPWSRKK